MPPPALGHDHSILGETDTQTRRQEGDDCKQTRQCGMAMEGGRDFLLQRQGGSALHAGAADPPVANTLENLKGLGMEEPIVEHQCNDP